MDRRRTLGAVIRARRIELGLTQEALAERIAPHFRQSDVSRLERDCITLPRRERLEAIAAALEIPVGVLLAASGWAGMELDATPAPITRPGQTTPIAVDEVAIRRFDIAPMTIPGIDRLHAALAESASVRLQAVDLLARLRDIAWPRVSVTTGASCRTAERRARAGTERPTFTKCDRPNAQIAPQRIRKFR